MVQEISVHDYNAKLQRGENIILVDVRTPAEFREVHAEAAYNLPLDKINEKSVLEIAGDKQVHFICRSGSRSKKACEIVGTKAISVSGGTNAWVEAGLSVKRGKEVISIERQVRIVAGSLVLLGVLLGQTVSSAFLWVPAFVGAGLVFSGVTDFCGMALLLGRMPWNQ